MSCPNPLYRLAASPDSLRSLGFIGDRSSDFLGKRPRRGAYFFTRKQLDLIPPEFRSNLQPIGCGRCLACRLQYSSEWSLRLRLESSLYENNLFVTLTYDDDHLPESVIVDQSTGELYLSELQKLDVSKFMKRLRTLLHDRFNFDGVRYFASGEYGDRSSRPHYHVILMNLPTEILRELRFLSKTPRGDFLYTSPFFDDIWKKGFVTIGRCTSESIGYVARYALKKVSSFERTSDREPVFALMSRRPGIGAPFFEKHRESIEHTGKVVVTDNGKSSIVSAPSYFLYLSKNLPVRAHRLPDTLHYSSDVLSAQRQAEKVVSDLKEARAAALDHRDDAYSADLLNLPRAAAATSRSRLDTLNQKLDILEQKQKRYSARFKSL